MSLCDPQFSSSTEGYRHVSPVDGTYPKVVWGFVSIAGPGIYLDMAVIGEEKKENVKFTNR